MKLNGFYFQAGKIFVKTGIVKYHNHHVYSYLLSDWFEFYGQKMASN